MFKLELLKAVFFYSQIHDTMNIMRLFDYLQSMVRNEPMPLPKILKRKVNIRNNISIYVKGRSEIYKQGNAQVSFSR